MIWGIPEQALWDCCENVLLGLADMKWLTIKEHKNIMKLLSTYIDKKETKNGTKI